MKTYHYEVSAIIEVEAESIMVAETSISGEGIKITADPLHSVRTPSAQQTYRRYDWLRSMPCYARLKVISRSHRRLNDAHSTRSTEME